MATASKTLHPPPTAYESDGYGWALEQARLLRERRLTELDLDNLADEVEALARSEAKELRSRYEILLRHLLEWEFHPDKRTSSWEITIGRERREISEHLTENPGLQPKRAGLFAKAYPTDRDNAAIETKLPLRQFPAENPTRWTRRWIPSSGPVGRTCRRGPGDADARARDRMASVCYGSAMATIREQLRPPPSYEGDFYGWALQQAALLRARRFDLLDLENLAEEVEDLARRHADALQSRYEILIQHLLKWEFQPSQRSYGWAGTIRRERGKITRLLDKNPGLKPRRLELFDEAFEGGRAEAAIECDLPIEHFPEVCPYTLDQAMDPEFWPGGRDVPPRTGGRRRGP